MALTGGEPSVVHLKYEIPLRISRGNNTQLVQGLLDLIIVLHPDRLLACCQAILQEMSHQLVMRRLIIYRVQLTTDFQDVFFHLLNTRQFSLLVPRPINKCTFGKATGAVVFTWRVPAFLACNTDPVPVSPPTTVQPCFLSGGRSFVFHTSEGPMICDLNEDCTMRKLFDDGVRRQL